MEKRFFIALLLAAAVVAITQILFPVARPALATRGKNDSLSTSKIQNRSVPSVSTLPSSIVPAPVDSVSAVTSTATAELTTLETPKSILSV